MVDSSFPPASQVSHDPSTIHVTLRGLDGHDPLVRELDLTMDSAFPIGRASKSGSKQGLLPAAHNAFIDSAVISRNHAVLTALNADGTPDVFITDRGSMHGTLVNGKSLDQNVPCKLHSGDIVQLGIDVNRNEEFHKARQYMFYSSPNPSSEPFSHGFSVPDDDSEDEEPGPSIHSEPYIPNASSYASLRRGSQEDPFVIDSTSSEDEDILELAAGMPDTEEVDTALVAGEGVILQVETTTSNVEVSSSTQDFPESALRSTVLASSADDDVSSDDEMYEGTAFELGASSDGLDDVNASEHEEAEDGMEELSQLDDYVDLNFSEEPPSVPETDSHFSSANIPRYLTGSEYRFDTPLPALEHLRQGFDDLPTASTFIPPPPQPFQSLFAPASVRHEQPTASDAWSAEAVCDKSHPLPLIAPTHAAHSMALADANLVATASAPQAQVVVTREAAEPSIATAAPNRRTRVSIDEIVEEQHPLTPESINDRKRRADVLDEAQTPAPALRHSTPSAKALVTPIQSEQAPATHNLTSPPESATVTAEPAMYGIPSIHEALKPRPKLQPHSIRKKLRNTVAVLGYTAVGATVGAIASFAALSTLPDAFFSV